MDTAPRATTLSSFNERPTLLTFGMTLPEVETVLAICRFLHFTLLMLVWGGGGFIVWLSPAALGARLRHDARNGLSIIAILLALVTLAMVPLESARIAGDWNAAVHLDVWLLLLRTTSGEVWQWHLPLGLITAALLAPPFGRWQSIAVVLSGILLASLALTGHPVAQSGAVGLFHRASHAVHLLAAGAWVGSLIPLLACLHYLRDGELRTASTTALQRFSRYGHLAVLLAVVSGAANAWLILGDDLLAVRSPYVALLAIKSLVVAVMILLALFNRYVLVPSMGRHPARTLRTLTFDVWLGIALAAMALALVSVFAGLDPRAVQ